MGYASTLISTTNNEDLDKIINIFKKCGIRCQGDDTFCPFKIRIEQDFKVKPYFKDDFVNFKKGKEFLYMVGDKFTQKNTSNLFELQDRFISNLLSEEELNIISSIDTIFIDNLEIEDVLDNSKGLITQTSLKIEPDAIAEEYLNTSEMLFEKICADNTLFKHNCDMVYRLTKEEVLERKNKLIQVCKELKLDLQLKENECREEVFVIEGIDLFYCSTGVDEKGLYIWVEPAYNSRYSIFAKSDKYSTPVERFARVLENKNTNK